MAIKSVRELLSRVPGDGDVRHLLRSFNLGMLGDKSPPSVQQLAQRLGFDVVLCAMSRRERGKLVTDPFAENGFRIEVNEADDVRTRRWTVLHEIMHWLLHPRDDPLAFDQYRAGGAHFYNLDEMHEEREANAFVEALVFGDGALEAARGLFGNDRKGMAVHFGVSLPTLDRALRKL